MAAADIRMDFAESASADLHDIIEWYESQDAPAVGRRLVTQVIERVEQLALSPDSGKMVPEFETPWLREIWMPPLRIVYRLDEEVVTVVRVWRSERLMDPSLLGNA